MAMKPPQTHEDALQQQLRTGTPEQQRHAQQALDNLPKPPSGTISRDQAQALHEISGGKPDDFRFSESGQREQRKRYDTRKREAPARGKLPQLNKPLTPQQKHVNRLADQLNTGSALERKWAEQALEKLGFSIHGQNIANNPSFNPALKTTLASYQTRPKDLLSKDQFKAIWSASGGAANDFNYTEPIFYDTASLVDDIKTGNTNISKHEYENVFGTGSYDKQIQETKKLGLIRIHDQWLDAKWFNKLNREEQGYLKDHGFSKWEDTYYVKDPVTGRKYYRKDMLEEWGKRTHTGHITGEIDWKTAHYDIAASTTWDILSQRNIRSTRDGGTSDPEMLALAKSYKHDRRFVEGMQETLAAYRRLDPYEKSILQGNKKFGSKSGMEGLILYNDAQVDKRELASRVILKYADKNGDVDVSQLAVDSLKGKGNRKAVETILEAGGYQKQDIKEVADYAEKYVAMSDPWAKKSYKEQFLTVLDWEGRILVPGYDLARSWNEYSNTERSIYGMIDVLSLLPVIGAAGKAGRLATATTKGSRGLRGLKNIGQVGVEITGLPLDISRRSIKGLATGARHPITASKELGSAVKSLAKLGIYPMVHPLDTTIGISRVVSGKVDLPSGWLLGEGAAILAPYGVVSVNLKSGDEIVWTGLKLGNQPLIGKSGKKGWVVGTPKDLGISIKDIDAGGAGWIAGEKASAKLEAKVLNPTVLQNAGLSPEAARMIDVFKEASKATGKVKPGFVETVIPLDDVARIESVEGVQYVLDKISREGGGVIYGSFITEKQLHPDIKKYMRKSKDIDIHTNWSVEKAQRVSSELASQLRKITGNQSYKVDPKKGIGVVVDVNGKPHHAIDLHIDPETESWLGSELSGEWAWGIDKVAQPPVVFSTQSGLQIKGQSIAEQVRRKGATSTKIQEGGILGPSQRRLKDPGDWRMYLASVAREKGVNRKKVERLIKEIEDYYGLEPFDTIEQSARAGAGAAETLMVIPPKKLNEEIWENIASSAVYAGYNTGFTGRSILIPASGSIRNKKSPSSNGKYGSQSRKSKPPKPDGKPSPPYRGSKPPSPGSKPPPDNYDPASPPPIPVLDIPPKPPISPIDIPIADTVTTKRKAKKRGTPGIVAWNQGEVTKNGERQRVYVIAHHDGEMIKRGKGGVVVQVGKPPAGMKRIKGTPQQTLSILGGQPPSELKVKVGNVRATVRGGNTITFRSAKPQGKIVRGKQPSIIRGRGKRR